MTLAHMHNKMIANQVRASGTSFYWPMLFQNRSYREALFAIYAYCRVLDDIADRPGTIESKRNDLEGWRLQLNHLFSNEPVKTDSQDILVNVLADAIERFNLPQAPFNALIDGMETDVNGPLVAPDWQSLHTYCERVAGAVGQLCLAVWGWRGPEADQFATATGEALQLTNILRDLKEDSAIGRLYLPEEALATARIDTRIPLEVLSHPNLNDACALVIAQTKIRFSDAHECWRKSEARTARPAWVMLQLYEALFLKIVRTGFGPNRARARLSKAEKVYHLLRAYVTA